MKKRPVKMLIAGPRYIEGNTEWTDFPFLERSVNDVLDRLWLMPDIVVSGGAIGADKMGEKWAHTYEVGVKVIRPDYDLYPPYTAPLVRNGWMAQEVDFGVIFWNKSRGTKNMIGHMERFHKPAFIVDVQTGEIELRLNDCARQARFAKYSGIEPIHSLVLNALAEYPLEPKEIR